MTTDYYAEAREIAMNLKRDGLTVEAQAVVDAIESGSTGTEILMALRWHLEQIDESSATKGLPQGSPRLGPKKI